ncbi:hypothetical protein T440DRAFT_103504 [Plenodomus tracheiphilus IPT5]|uniref:Uncharacterized protein n=1 Tax=Plenodomus tracheiphilus IPT5 TaxID=1408161 RepID=A0A6A7BM54_9PLEO|nr:hypothetical protein T440DRAFT_103504 [Plenodomus tracheiphilus IPT5]
MVRYFLDQCFDIAIILQLPPINSFNQVLFAPSSRRSCVSQCRSRIAKLCYEYSQAIGRHSNHNICHKPPIALASGRQQPRYRRVIAMRSEFHRIPTGINVFTRMGESLRSLRQRRSLHLDFATFPFCMSTEDQHHDLPGRGCKVTLHFRPCIEQAWFLWAALETTD